MERRRGITRHETYLLKRGSRGVCALWSVTEIGNNRGIMSMWLLEDDDLATGEELSINVLHQTKHRHLRSPLGRHHHAFSLRAYSLICLLLDSAFDPSHCPTSSVSLEIMVSLQKLNVAFAQLEELHSQIGESMDKFASASTW